MGQLLLFSEPAHAVPKCRYYLDLNIHEKINVKGNSLQFARTYLQQARYRVHVITRYDHPEGLQWKSIRWHLDHNPESIETILWQEKRKNLLELK